MVDATVPNQPGDSFGNTPSIDPANDGTLIGLLQTFYNKMTQNTDGMLPAKVIAYNRTTNRVQVQPLITVLTTDGTSIPRAQIASLPVVQLGGGGFEMLFNLVPGDLGWILASDRDISLFLQTYQQAQPNTLRKKSFSDSIFIPHRLTKQYIVDVDEDEDLIIQKIDGTVRLALSSNKIKITAPSRLKITGTPLTLALEVTGNVYVNGKIEASGDITPHVPP